VVKMVKEKVWKAGTISLLVLLLGSMGVNVSQVTNDEGYLPYTCDKESVADMLCYKLSRVNDAGFQRNCYFDRDNSRRYKGCSTGWELLEPDDFVTEECSPYVVAYTDNGKYFCDKIGSDAKCVRDGTLEMPI